VVLVWLYKVEVRSETLGESVVAVKLKLSTDDGVTTGTLRSKTSVVSTSGSLVVLSEVDWSIVVGSSTATGGSVCPSNRGSSLRSAGVGTKVGVGSVVNTGEGNSRVTRLDVGVKGSDRGKETVGLDGTEGIIVEVISVVVPLIHAELNNRVTLNNPDQFFHGMIEI